MTKYEKNWERLREPVEKTKSLIENERKRMVEMEEKKKSEGERGKERENGR